MDNIVCLFLRYTLVIFPHPESSLGQAVFRYNSQNELRLTKKYTTLRVLIICVFTKK